MRSFGLLFLLVTSSLYARSFSMHELPFGEWEQEFQEAQAGTRQEQPWDWNKEGKGYLCKYRMSTRGKVSGVFDRMTFRVLNPDQFEATVTLNDLEGHAKGSYRGDYTLCAPLGLGTGFAAERAALTARVTYREANPIPEMVIEIRSTTLEELHFTQRLPAWMEKKINDGLNMGLRNLWGTSFGKWLSQKLTEELRRRFPVQGPLHVRVLP